jgi:hypothetical protein
MTGTVILPEFLIDVPGQPPKTGWGVRILGDTIHTVAPAEELRRRFHEDQV